MVQAVEDDERYQALLPQAQEQRRRTRREFAVKMTSLAPRIFVRMTDNWIELSLVYPVENDLRRTFRSEISRYILAEFARAGVTIASQTVTVMQVTPSVLKPAAPTLRREGRRETPELD